VLRCRQWRLQAAIQGSGQPNLSKGIIDDIALPVPEPEEQIQIASLMDSLEDRLLSEECYCVKLKSIKKGLMQDLLTGRVRVNAEASVKER
jgi:type I restriction enzyme S subunit